jgi:transcriptional regulator with XRE-family HTH domain
MVSGAQIKAARILLGWSGRELGKRANLSQSTIWNAERGVLSEATSLLLIYTLEAGGVKFGPSGQLSVVKLAQNARPRSSSIGKRRLRSDVGTT